jgi:hypothetical protein
MYLLRDIASGSPFVLLWRERGPFGSLRFEDFRQNDRISLSELSIRFSSPSLLVRPKYKGLGCVTNVGKGVFQEGTLDESSLHHCG